MKIILHLFDTRQKARYSFKNAIYFLEGSDCLKIKPRILEYTYGNGRHIYMVPTPEKIKGMEISSVILDEDSMFSGKVIHTIWSRMR